MNPTPTSAPPAAPSFWQRRVVAPLRAQLMQGATPDRLALAAGVGTAVSVIPFFGFTTLANLGVGVALRLNQPVMQALNHLLGPVQLGLILVYVRLGEKLWGADPVPISLSILTQAFKEDPRAFLQRFGWTGIHAASAWALSAPFIIAGIYYALRPALRRLARARLG